MIYIGSDHRGFELKGHVAKWLSGRQMEFEDMGNYEYDNSDDYVDYAVAVAQKVSANPDKNWGVVICGSGVGVCVAANKVKNVWCGLGFTPDQVHSARKEDNINVLAIPADCVDENVAMDLIEKFFETEFVKSDKYLRRREKVERYENKVFDSKGR